MIGFLGSRNVSLGGKYVSVESTNESRDASIRPALGTALVVPDSHLDS